MVMMPNTAFLDFIFNILIFIPTQISVQTPIEEWLRVR